MKSNKRIGKDGWDGITYKSLHAISEILYKSCLRFRILCTQNIVCISKERQHERTKNNNNNKYT